MEITDLAVTDLAVSQKVTKRQQTDLCKKSKERTKIEALQLTQILNQVCALQQGYGKKVDDFGEYAAGFLWATADFSYQEIVAALGVFVKKEAHIPTPADIIKIIEKTRENFVSDEQRAATIKSLVSNGGAQYVTAGDLEWLADYEKGKKHERD